MSTTYAPSTEMRVRHGIGRKVVLAFWVLAIATFPIWIHFDQPAWDAGIYLKAIHALRAGHDPYADAIAIQQLFHKERALHPNAPVPYSYVYSPITLPLLRLAGRLPLLLVAGLYWLVYAAGVLTQTWVGMQATEDRERPYFLYLAPVAMFFPGFLACDNVLSGNIAYILYGLVLLAAVHGWRRNDWKWFYLVTVAASCFKAPLLSLLALPVLSARRQWLPAGLAAAAGIALFALQPAVWPVLFRHFLEAVELQFSYNRDFGVSPAGLFGGVLFDRGIPYSPGSFLFYLAYAIPIFALLVSLSRKFLRGSFSLQQWMPVLLVGVILLNPRLIEYDVAPLALPLALIAWRFFRSFTTTSRTILYMSVVFAALNVIAFQSWNIWKLTEGPLLIVFLAAGCWTLQRQSERVAEPASQPGTGVPGRLDTTRAHRGTSRPLALACPTAMPG